MQGIAPPRSSVANDPEYRKWIDAEPVRKEWQAALDVLATKGSSEVGYPIVANPESREFIGQAVQDLILKQKTVDQACADADKALDGADCAEVGSADLPAAPRCSRQRDIWKRECPRPPTH